MDVNGITVEIEFNKGDWKPNKESPYETDGWYMYADYGHIRNTRSMEPGEYLDVMIGDVPSDKVYMAFLTFHEGCENEQSEVKVMMNFKDEDAAYKILENQYWCSIMKPLVGMTVADFKTMLEQDKWAAFKDQRWIVERGYSLGFEGEEAPEEELMEGDLGPPINLDFKSLKKNLVIVNPVRSGRTPVVLLGMKD